MKTTFLCRIGFALFAVFLLTGLVSAQQASNLPEGMVYPSGRVFMISDGAGGGTPYYFSGTNNYYLMYKPMEMVEDVLNDMVHLGQKAVRMWLFMDGASHDGFVLQSAPGVYDEYSMQHIDAIMVALAQRGLKAVPVFVNYWSDFGGMNQYATWAGTSATEFYSNATCKQIYKDYISMWANRVNSITGVTYKDDPTILSWQLTNEARATSANLDDFIAWTREMSDFLRAEDPNHMISLGDEGFFNYAYQDIDPINANLVGYQITNDWTYCGSNGDWEAIIQMPNISYGTIHNYATDNWGYTVEWGESWTKYHIEVANRYNKPCVMEEYDKAYSGNWTRTADQERAEVLDRYQTIIRDWDMAGDMSWMLVGRNYTDPVEAGYTMDNTAPVEEIWLYRVKWPGDGHQYSRYDPYTGPILSEHCRLMNEKSGSTGPLKPIADAGDDVVVIDSDQDGTESVTLDGSGSFDPDGNIASYVWSEGGTQLATGVNPTIAMAAGTHSVTLTVTDQQGETGFDIVTISVLEGGARVFEAELASLSGNNNVASEAGASNGAYVQMAANPADIEFTIDNVPASLTYPVTISHRSYDANAGNGSKNQYITSSAGGGSIDYVFNPSTTWVQEIIDLPLNTGSNTITISASWGYTEFDYISIDGIGGGGNVNQTPIADAGPNQSVTDADSSGAEMVTLDGSGSSDPDGNIDQYIWVEDGITIANGITADVNFAVGTHNVQLTVIDNEGSSSADFVTITVVSGVIPNQSPVANAGSNQTVTDTDDNGIETITLDGTASSDTDGSIVSYVWSEGTTQLTTGAIATFDFETGTHTVTLTVTDDDGALSSDNVTITVESSGSGTSCSSDDHCPPGYVCAGWPDYVCVPDGSGDTTGGEISGPSKIGIHWSTWDASHYADYTTYITNLESWSIDYISLNPTYFIDTWAEGIITTWEGARKTPTIATQKAVVKELIARGFYINYRPHVDPIKYGMAEGPTRDNWSTIPGGLDWRGKFDQLDPTDAAIGYREIIILPGLQMLAEAIREQGIPVTPIRFDLGAELMDAMLNYPQSWIDLQNEVKNLLATTYSDVANHIVLGHNFCHHIEYLLRLPDHAEYMERIEPNLQVNPEGQYLDREGVTQTTRLTIGQYIAGLDETSISQYIVRW